MRGSIKITFSQFKSYCTHNFIKHDIPGDDKERCRVYGPKLQLCVSKNCPVWKLFKIRAKTYEEKITVARVRAMQQPRTEICQDIAEDIIALRESLTTIISGKLPVSR